MALPSDDLLSSSSFRSRVSGQGIPRPTAHGHRVDPSRKDTQLCSDNGIPAGSGKAATPNAPSLIHEREEHERQHQTRGTVNVYDQSTCRRGSRVTGPPRSGTGWSRVEGSCLPDRTGLTDRTSDVPWLPARAHPGRPDPCVVISLARRASGGGAGTRSLVCYLACRTRMCGGTVRFCRGPPPDPTSRGRVSRIGRATGTGRMATVRMARDRRSPDPVGISVDARTRSGNTARRLPKAATCSRHWP